jgi:translation initiation factor 1
MRSKDQPVYSTAGGTNTAKSRDSKSSKPSQWRMGSGQLKMRVERKGRGGKIATVLFNVPISEVQAEKLLKDLKDRLGCGGAIKDSEIVLQGDIPDRVEKALTQLGHKVVRAGG